MFLFLTLALITQCRPEIFKSTGGDDSNGSSLLGLTPHQEENEHELSDEDDGLPPLEANTNRIRPFELQSDTESESDQDS